MCATKDLCERCIFDAHNTINAWRNRGAGEQQCELRARTAASDAELLEDNGAPSPTTVYDQRELLGDDKQPIEAIEPSTWLLQTNHRPRFISWSEMRRTLCVDPRGYLCSEGRVPAAHPAVRADPSHVAKSPPPPSSAPPPPPPPFCAYGFSKQPPCRSPAGTLD